MKLKILGKWNRDLIMCPSQCCLPVEFCDKKYVLYLRWRHQDPWQGHIWTVDEINMKSFFYTDNKIEWSPELFSLYHEQYSCDEHELAEKRIIKLAEKYLKEEK